MAVRLGGAPTFELCALSSGVTLAARSPQLALGHAPEMLRPSDCMRCTPPLQEGVWYGLSALMVGRLVTLLYRCVRVRQALGGVRRR